MFRYRSPDLSSRLPQRTVTYLRSGAPEGSRNEELFDAACQFRDSGHAADECEEQLLARASADGLSETEALHTIRSAFTRSAREPAGRNGSGRRKSTKRDAPGPGTPIEPPPAPIDDGFVPLLDACFEDTEFVAIAPAREDDEGEIQPQRGVTMTAAEWKARVARKGGIDRCFGTKHGLFVRINPMIKDGARNDHVTAFRHALVEFDRDETGKPIPKEEQYLRIVASGLPVAALIDSGNKSLHAWIRVDAPDEKEYHRRVNVIWELFEGLNLDRQNRNASRLSRCPDGWRTVDGEVRRQSLLATGLGAASWDEWVRSREGAESAIRMPVAELAGYDTGNDPNNVLGKRWLCRGGSLVIVGQSGVGKSSLCMQLMILWALGRPAFHITPVTPLRSLLIQAENDIGDLAEMYQGVRQGMELTAKEEALLDERIIIYRDTTRTGEAFVDLAGKLVEQHKPDLVWVDPLLNYIGDEISEQRVISDFCCRMLNGISLRTGVIWCLLHHTGKPSRDPKASSHWTASDLAYSGLGSSALTNWSRETLVLVRIKTPAGTPPTFQFSATKRRMRAGFLSTAGDPTDTIFLRHSNRGGICWDQCEEPEPEKKTSTSKYTMGGRKSNFDPVAFRAIVNAFGGTVNRANVKNVAAASKCAKRTIWSWWKKLKDSELEVLQKHPAESTAETQPATAASAADIPPL